MHPIFLVLFLLLALFFNFIGLMQLIPLFITLPLLFIAIYLTLHSIIYRKKVYRRMR